MINVLFSIVFPAGGSRVANYEDDDRLSSVCSIESDSESKSSCTTSEDSEYDHPHSVETPSSTVCPPSRTEVQAPEVAHTLGRSASLPSALRRVPTVCSSPSPYQHQKLTRSTHSLRPPLPPIKPLSPIYEPVDLAHDEDDVRVVTSPMCTQPSPSSLRERIIASGSQGNHQAFIKRSLKRSLSHTSTSSLRPVASGVPKLPPLNLRPHFHADGSLLSSPQNSPRSAQSSQSCTPQSVTSLRSHRFGFMEHPQKYSAIYEDASSDRTGSFVTARSGVAEPGPAIITKQDHDIPSTADLVVHIPEEMSPVQGVVEDTGVVADRISFDACLDMEKTRNTLSDCSTASTAIKNNIDFGDEGHKENTIREEDSMIMKRWTRGILTTRNDPDELVQRKSGGETNHTRQARLLFWLGFVAPWCWLIGGWMLSQKAGEDSEKQITVKDEATEELTGIEENGGCMKSFKNMIFPHPSSSFTTSSSTLSAPGSITVQLKKPGDSTELKVWTSRCRIAAIAGGVILSLALFITLTVLT